MEITDKMINRSTIYRYIFKMFIVSYCGYFTN